MLHSIRREGVEVSKVVQVIYHYPCLDGFTAAWAAYRYFKDKADYIPGIYGNEEIPDVKGKTVYLVDFSYPEDILRKIAKQAYRVIVLDHHVTAEKNLKKLVDERLVEANFDMSRSGAVMTWEYLHPTKDVPEFVKYVSDRDLWKFELPNSKEVNAALFSRPYSFDEWDKLYDMSIEELITEGKVLMRRFNKDIAEIKENTRRMTIQGYDVPTVNANHMFGSDLGSQLSVGEPFAAYYWVNKDGEFVFGLRSQPNTVDVSKIAELFGGGGHKTASGFRVKDLNTFQEIRSSKK